ncbi:DUF1223 domain-containing protein [Ovoidimarina sediminis]|uniref:DUF1223 domain-containing protein n=1 Tax=Ovoidimarina sediminis TaxID=3079856 RepID=UPI00290FD10B|nr:DUF1223 domain-containing protein [Rhodophyticola sp. MJ-SS7]MDU8944979.1 DUF1223 domain-containing protein [Rhodophyticola sp. MJ-SS7]
MRTRLIGLLIALMTLLAVPASADRLVVIELFTSQGCSSCPPADALLGELAARDDVLPLALHVDYWDYIGWKDAFASHENTERQRAYAAAAGSRTIYTPQMIVGGRDHVIGYKPMKLAMLIEKHGESTEPAKVTLTRRGPDLLVEIAPAGRVPAAQAGGPIQLVLFRASETVDIRRGENAGKTYTYHNIVEELRPIGTWDGKTRVELKVPNVGSSEIAVLVQAPDNGPILGAARVR